MNTWQWLLVVFVAVVLTWLLRGNQKDAECAERIANAPPDTVYMPSAPVEQPAETIKAKIRYITDTATVNAHKRRIAELEELGELYEALLQASEPFSSTIERTFRRDSSWVSIAATFHAYPLSPEKHYWEFKPVWDLRERTITKLVPVPCPDPFFQGAFAGFSVGSEWRRFEPYMQAEASLRFRWESTHFEPMMWYRVSEHHAPQGGWTGRFSWRL